MLTDKFGRAHNYLRISLTERCNLRCFYCMPPEGILLSPPEHIMQADEVIKIASEFVSLGVDKIRLTGGEPLVRKDIEVILTGLSKLNSEIAISTNGVALDKYFDLLEKTKVKHLNISLDTLNKEKFKKITNRDYFERVITNIHTAIDKGFIVKINVVVIKGENEYEILDFIELTKQLPLSIRFIEFMPFNGNQWDKGKGMSLQEIISFLKEQYGAKLKKLTDKPNDTTRNYAIEGYKGSFGVISTVTNPFCDTCNRIRLTANGCIRNCLFSNNENNLLEALRKGEDIKPIIEQVILNKKKVRGGMEEQSDFENPEFNQKNRSMVMIGG